MKHKFLLLYTWFIRIILFFLPDAPLIMAFRGWLYSFGMKSCGKNFQVAHNVILNTIETMSIGNNVYIAPNCVFLGGGDIVIEDEVIFGPNVVVASGNHTRIDRSFRFASVRYKSIFVGKGSWIGANCTLVPGAYLPPGSILAANSVLNKKYTEAGLLLGGVPAKIIKKIN